MDLKTDACKCLRQTVDIYDILKETGLQMRTSFSIEDVVKVCCLTFSIFNAINTLFPL